MGSIELNDQNNQGVSQNRPAQSYSHHEYSHAHLHGDQMRDDTERLMDGAEDDLVSFDKQPGQNNNSILNNSQNSNSVIDIQVQKRSIIN